MIKDGIKALVRFLIKRLYRLEVEGIENYAKLGKRAVIVCNHQSFLDAAILALFLPGKPYFAINEFVAKKKILKPFLGFYPIVTVDPSSPLGIRSLVDLVAKDNKIVIFPEGRITVTGTLMKFYDGPTLVADKTGADILPVCLEGAEYTTFSRMKGKLKLRWFPKLRLTIFPPIRLSEHGDKLPKIRRRLLAQELYDIMCDRMFRARKTGPIFAEIVKAADKHGWDKKLMSDVTRTCLSYSNIITRAHILGEQMAKHTDKEEYTGLLLANSNAVVVAFLGLQAYGRIPAMLNFTAGANALQMACKTAKLRCVFTSRKFVDAANLYAEIEAISETAKVIFLEDLAKKISLGSKLKWLLLVKLGCGILKHSERDPAKPATILFTSGSEGTPKGVVLSHNNLVSNLNQMAIRVDFGSYDKVLNMLPVFHSFGLMAGTLLPLMSGTGLFLYPSPLHYRIIPEVAYEYGATIMFGTDTFLSKYAKYAHPYDFNSIRYIFAGAEKLKEETRKLWLEKFGVRVFEGYGVTETSPVISVNTAIENKAGTVGKFMPGMEWQLLPVPGIEEGGRLYVHGPNVMMGYMKYDNPGVIEPLVTEAGAGWHDTGDIVEVDEEGFITIKGRAKRFAKIGGEMVSLTYVEAFISKIWPDKIHAVVSKPDPRKGEQLFLVTNEDTATLDAIQDFTRAQGITELYVPRKIIYVSQMPLLGSGKIDYQKIKLLVE